MGKQIRVYLLPSDALNFLAELRKAGPLVLLARESDSPSPTILQSSLITQRGFTRADSLLAMDLSSQIRMEPTKRGPWSVDTLVSEVIEFGACYFDQKTIKQGRLYYTQGFYKADGAWQEKSSRFLHWAQTVFRVSRSLLINDAELNAYVGRDAQQWRASGGVFISYAAKGQEPIVAGAKAPQSGKKGTA